MKWEPEQTNRNLLLIYGFIIFVAFLDLTIDQRDLALFSIKLTLLLHNRFKKSNQQTARY